MSRIVIGVTFLIGVSMALHIEVALAQGVHGISFATPKKKKSSSNRAKNSKALSALADAKKRNVSTPKKSAKALSLIHI